MRIASSWGRPITPALCARAIHNIPTPALCPCGAQAPTVQPSRRRRCAPWTRSTARCTGLRKLALCGWTCSLTPSGNESLTLTRPAASAPSWWAPLTASMTGTAAQRSCWEHREPCVRSANVRCVRAVGLSTTRPAGQTSRLLGLDQATDEDGRGAHAFSLGECCRSDPSFSHLHCSLNQLPGHLFLDA